MRGAYNKTRLMPKRNKISSAQPCKVASKVKRIEVEYMSLSRADQVERIIVEYFQIIAALLCHSPLPDALALMFIACNFII